MPFNIFDGSSWNPLKKAKIYDGSSWQDAKAINIYDGSTWQKVSSFVPENTVAPTIIWQQYNGLNDYGVGQTVSVNTGTWTNNTSITFTYKWYKAQYTTNATKNWMEIIGATSSTFAIPADSTYVGYLIKCVIIATNQSGPSLPTDTAYTGQFITPQAISGVYPVVTSNISATLYWNQSAGATGYEIQYWQSNVYYNVSLGNTNSWTLDTTAFDPQYGIGIYIAPVNNSNPATTALGGYKVQGGTTNSSFADIRPNKPSVVFTAPNGQINGSNASWTVNNMTETSWEIYAAFGIFASSPSLTYYGTTETSQFLQYYDPATISGPWYVKVTGTVLGYSAPQVIQSNNVTFQTAANPPSRGSASLSPSGTQYVGTSITAADGGTWIESLTISSGIIVKYGSAPTSATDGTKISGSYTITSSDVNANAYFKAYSTANNSAGSTSVISAETVHAIVTPSSGGGAGSGGGSTTTYYSVPDLTGSQISSVINGGNGYTVYVGSTVATSAQSLDGVIATQSPAAGTQINTLNLPVQITVHYYAWNNSSTNVSTTYTVPNLVTSTIADGNYGTYIINTNGVFGTSDQTSNNQIRSQSPIDGTVYTNPTLPYTINVVRYQYQAGSYSIYVDCNGFSQNYFGAYGTPTPSSGHSFLTGTTSNPNLSSANIIAILGIPAACASYPSFTPPTFFAPPFFFAPPTFFAPPFFFTPPTFFAPPFFFTPPTFFAPPFFFTPPTFFSPPSFFSPPAFGGCLIYGTEILMADGSWKNMEILQVGELVMAADIPTVPDDDTLFNYMTTWSAEDISATTKTTSEVTNVELNTYNRYYRINDLINITWEHIIPFQRDGIWRFKNVLDLKIGDMIMTDNLEIVPVISKEEIVEDVNTVSINIDPKDVYFVRGLMAHNQIAFKQ